MIRKAFPLVLLAALFAIAAILWFERPCENQVESQGTTESPAQEILEATDITIYRAEVAHPISETEDSNKLPILLFQLSIGEREAAAVLSIYTTLYVLVDGDERKNATTVFCNEKGEFRLPIREAYIEGSARTLSLHSPATNHDPERMVVLDLSYALSPGEHFLGTLLFQPLPFLVQGSVLDSAGRPIFGAIIALEKNIGSEMADSNNWMELFDTNSNRDGGFTLRGDVDPGSYRLSIKHPEYTLTTKDILLGERGVEIHLRRFWSMEGRILLDSGIDPQQLEIVVLEQQDEVKKHPAIMNRALIKSDGSFLIVEQPEGEAVLVVRCRHLTPSLFTRKIQLGDSGGFFQMEDIDLRGAINTFVVKVMDWRGQYPHDIWAATLGGSRIAKAFDEPLTILTTKASLDLVIGAEGARSVTLYGVQSDLEVFLEQGLPVHITVDNLPTIPEEFFFFFCLYFEPGAENNQPSLRSFRSPYFSEEGCWLPTFGTYQFRLRVWGYESKTINGIQSMESWSSSANLTYIEVRNEETLQNIHVSIPEVDLISLRDFLAHHRDM